MVEKQASSSRKEEHAPLSFKDVVKHNLPPPAQDAEHHRAFAVPTGEKGGLLTEEALQKQLKKQNIQDQGKAAEPTHGDGGAEAMQALARSHQYEQPRAGEFEATTHIGHKQHVQKAEFGQGFGAQTHQQQPTHRPAAAQPQHPQHAAVAGSAQQVKAHVHYEEIKATIPVASGPVAEQQHEKQVIRTVTDAPMVELVEQKVLVDETKHDRIEEVHEKTVFEIHERPTTQLFSHAPREEHYVLPTKYERTEEQELASEKQQFLRGEASARIVHLPEQLQHTQQQEEIVRRREVEKVEVHNRPVIREIHEQPVHKIYEQPIVRTIIERPEIRIVREEQHLQQQQQQKASGGVGKIVEEQRLEMQHRLQETVVPAAKKEAVSGGFGQNLLSLTWWTQLFSIALFTFAFPPLAVHLSSSFRFFSSSVPRTLQQNWSLLFFTAFLCLFFWLPGVMFAGTYVLGNFMQDFNTWWSGGIGRGFEKESDSGAVGMGRGGSGASGRGKKKQ